MPERAQRSGGAMASVRRVGSSLLGLLRTRVELFAVEVQEEKLRAINLMVWFAAAIILGAAGVLVAFGALSLFLWQTAGYGGLVGLALAALAAAATTLWVVRRRILHGPPPFGETVAELRKDAACLRSPE